MPAPGPAFDNPAGHIARADHHIGRVAICLEFHAGQDRRQMTRVMAEIGVHVEHLFVAVLDGIVHAGDRGGSQSQLSRTVQTSQPRIAIGMASHHWPVPSGELSSMTRISTVGAIRRISLTKSGRFSISL